MFGKTKARQNNNRCPTCGHFMVAPGKGWITQSNTRRWEGEDAGNLTQTWPVPVPKPSRVKSITRTRLEQAIMVGMAITLCPMTCALSVGYMPTFPVALRLTTVVSSGVFVLSVALGSDNWQTIFRLLDRNKDGRIGVDDVRQIIDEMFPEDDSSTGPVHVPPPDIVVNDRGGTKTIAGPEPYVVRSLVVRIETVDQPALIVDIDTLCSFIRAAAGLNEWTRRYWISKKRGKFKLSPDTWQAYFHFFNRNDVKLWGINPPAPELPGMLIKFRTWATDQPETNQPTGVKC